MLTSKTQAQGGSITTSIPSEVLRRLGIKPGDDLYWVEDGSGSYHVTPFNPEAQDALAAFEAVADQYKEVFKALAE